MSTSPDHPVRAIINLDVLTDGESEPARMAAARELLDRAYGRPTQALVDALAVLFALGAAWPVWRRLGLAFAVFILLNIVPALATGGLVSVGRHSSVLFPALIWLATAVKPRHRTGWIVGCAVAQSFNAALFYTWRPLY